MSFAMTPNSLPEHQQQTNSTRKPLSCTSCRQRKIKCDRVDPCDPCKKYGIECVFPTRRARGRRDAVGLRDSELLRRIKRLEGMLAEKVDKGSVDAAPIDNQGLTLIPPLPRNDGFQQQVPTNVENHYRSFVEDQGSSSRHLNSDFWSSLSSEFDGLRQLVESRIDDEDEFDDEGSQSTEAINYSPNFILQDGESLAGHDVVYPSTAHSAILFEFFFANVDPICKILHRPTVNTYFSNLEVLLDPVTHRFKFRSLEAVTFAAYFAAVTSMSSEECMTHLGESKDTLSTRYKHNAEVALVQANFLNSLEISTLQALTIYTVSIQ